MREATQRFIRANDQFPVIAGSARQQGGARYKLESGEWWTLSLAACRELPEGYPKWRLN